jgi:hypothetical protein
MVLMNFMKSLWVLAAVAALGGCAVASEGDAGESSAAAVGTDGQHAGAVYGTVRTVVAGKASPLAGAVVKIDDFERTTDERGSYAVLASRVGRNSLSVTFTSEAGSRVTLSMEAFASYNALRYDVDVVEGPTGPALKQH